MSFIKELWSYLNTRKKYWLFPVIFVMITLGILIAIAQSTAVAPFIYAIF